MLRLISMLCVSAIVGVAVATFTICTIELITGSGTFGLLPFYWFIGFPAAILAALILGIPFALLYRRLKLNRWWQYLIGATIAAVPIWYELAQPFYSARWQHYGLHDSLIYLGSGAIAGLAFWAIVRKFNVRTDDVR